MKVISRFYHLSLLVLLVSACSNRPPSKSAQQTTTTSTTSPTIAGPVVSPSPPTSNVTQVTFTQTFVPGNASSPKIFNFPSSVTTEMLEKSAVLVYIKSADFMGIWYPVPGGVGSSDNGPADVFRYYINPSQKTFSIFRESGDNVSQIIVTRVVIIPSDNSINGN